MAAKPMDELNARQQRFVREYLLDLNATAAYKRAGYKAKNDNVAGVEGGRLLRKPKIRAAVKRALDQRMFAVGLKGERVVREASDIARFDPADVLDFSGDSITVLPLHSIPEHARRAIAYIKCKDGQVTEIRFCSKLDALDLLFRHLGLYAADKGKAAPPAAPAPVQYEIDKLDLPLEVRRVLLEATKKAEAERARGGSTGYTGGSSRQ